MFMDKKLLELSMEKTYKRQIKQSLELKSNKEKK